MKSQGVLEGSENRLCSVLGGKGSGDMVFVLSSEKTEPGSWRIVVVEWQQAQAATRILRINCSRRWWSDTGRRGPERLWDLHPWR